MVTSPSISQRERWKYILIIGGLQTLQPFSLDPYLPSGPIIARGFDVPDSLIQLTLSALTLGFALGQLIAGPLIGDMTSAESLAHDDGAKASPFGGELIIAIDPAGFLGAAAAEHMQRAEALFADAVGGRGVEQPHSHLRQHLKDPRHVGVAEPAGQHDDAVDPARAQHVDAAGLGAGVPVAADEQRAVADLGHQNAEHQGEQRHGRHRQGSRQAKQPGFHSIQCRHGFRVCWMESIQAGRGTEGTGFMVAPQAKAKTMPTFRTSRS